GGSMDKAKEQAAEIVKLDPMRGYEAMSRIAARQKDLAGEEAAYKAMLAAVPDSGQPYYRLGAFYRRHARWAESFATYEQLKQARPNDIFAHAGWGFTAAQSGTNLERGERELKHFLENSPKDMAALTTSAAYFRLGQIYERTQRRDEARAAYAEAVKLNPQNQDAKKALDALK
ncbi:MAG: tetratricopeptide repeat protein, partial [Gemmatimonadaceae bacterium]